jgi:hypothetical protein
LLQEVRYYPSQLLIGIIYIDHLYAITQNNRATEPGLGGMAAKQHTQRWARRLLP